MEGSSLPEGMNSRTPSRESGLPDELAHQFENFGLIGQSRAMICVFEATRKVAQWSDTAVLLLGETGTGKELIARAIHRLDPQRSKGPFHAINCGSLNPNLLGSELFGHKKGAFTSADHDRPGAFVTAMGGTIFLDEIGELPLADQAALLRVLQEHVVLPVGADQPVMCNVRVIAATNQSLPEKVQAGKFRIDLYHRLFVYPIRLPPLRERIKDIVPLARHFLARHRTALPDLPWDFDPQVLVAFGSLSWPGNVRELENAVQAALINSNGGTNICLVDLSRELLGELETRNTNQPDLRVKEADPPRPDTNGAFVLDTLLPYKEAVRRVRAWLIQGALRVTHGNQTRATKILKLSRVTMRRAMQELGMTIEKNITTEESEDDSAQS